MSAEFEYSELTEFNKNMLDFVSKEYPKEAKKFIARAGNKLSKNIKSAYRKGTKKKTGNLLRGVARGRPYIFEGNDFQVRVYNKAPHAHLIEHGHKVFIRGKETRHRAKGRHIVGATAMAFQNEFAQLADKFVDDLLARGFG